MYRFHQTKFPKINDLADRRVGSRRHFNQIKIEALSLAQKERKVVVYNTTTAPDMAAIAQGFKKKYPFAEVEGYRGTGEKLLQRITTEIKAGQNLADVYLISGLQTWLLKDMNLLTAYRSPEREKIVAALAPDRFRATH